MFMTETQLGHKQLSSSRHKQPLFVTNRCSVIWHSSQKPRFLVVALVVSSTGPQCSLPLAELLLFDVRRVKEPVHDPRPCRSIYDMHQPGGTYTSSIVWRRRKINSGPANSQNESILFKYLKVLLSGQLYLSWTGLLEGLFLDGPVVVDVGLEFCLVNHVTDVLLTRSVCCLIRKVLSTWFGLEVTLCANTMYSCIISIKDLTNWDALTFIVRHLPKSHYRNSRVCRQLKAVGEAPFTVGEQFADRISLFLSANPYRKKSCRQTGLCRQELGRSRRPFADSHVVCRRRNSAVNSVAVRFADSQGCRRTLILPTTRAVGKMRVADSQANIAVGKLQFFADSQVNKAIGKVPTKAVGKKYTALPTAMVKAVGKAGIFFCCFIAFESHL